MILLVLLAALNTSGIDSLLLETPGNEIVWRNYIESVSGDTLESCLYLLENIPRLDRLEMTEEVLDDHINSALAFKGDIPDSIFMDYLLWYRVSIEPVSAYRALLQRFWDNHETTNPEGVSSWIEDNLEILDRRFLGEMKTPESVLAGYAGTSSELQVLEVSSMRTLGFPARIVTGWFGEQDGERKTWVETWEAGEWLPVTEQKSENLILVVEESHGIYLTENYTETGTLVVVPPEWEDVEFLISLNLPVEGRFIPLDWLMPDPNTISPDTLTLGAGKVLVSLTKRLPSGAVEVWNRIVTISPEEVFTLDFRSF